MKFAWSRLFATRYSRTTEIYATPRASLDAVRAGTKGMSVFGFPLAYIAAGGADYRALLKLAFDRELVVVLQRAAHEANAFVAKPDQLWRIPAWVAVRDTAFTDGAWSNAAEAHTSLLLGYTAKQRAAWIADAKHRHASWGCATIYTLLTPADKRRVMSLGKRCLVDGITVAFDRTGNGLVPDAFARIPAGVTLARVGLAWNGFREVFGRPSRGRVVTASVKRASRVNAALESTIQFLTRSGWR